MSDIVRNPRGPHVNKPLLYGGGVVVVFGAVWYVKHKRAATATDPAASDGTDPNASTGTDTGYDTSGFSDYSPAPGYGPVGTSTGIEPSQPPALLTNSQWTQAAEQYLTESGFDPLSSAVALGVYLASGPLTQSQYNIVTAALAGVGNPPIKPAPPHVLPPKGQNPPPTTTPGLKGAPHLSIASQTKTSVTVAWTRVTGATHYRLIRVDGTTLRDVVGTRATIAKVGHHETVHVVAYRYTRPYSHSSNAVGINPR